MCSKVQALQDKQYALLLNGRRVNDWKRKK